MGNKLIVGVNDLKSVNPELAAEWNYEKNGKLLPEMISAYSSKKVFWKGKCGHEWDAAVSDRNQGNGCPFCSGQKVLKGFNDLMTKRPDIASEWNFEKNGNLKPDMITVGANKKVWWICNNGHEWEALVNNRNKGKGCPYCSGRLAIKGVNDLKTVNPDLASEWNYEKNGDLKPTELSTGSNKKVWWKCSNGHEWQAAIRNRNQGNGCPFCSGQKVLKGFNDLVTLNHELAFEWNYEKNGKLLPSDVMPNTNKKVWWLGKCGHEWEAAVASRNQGIGCPYCSGRLAIKGVNDLMTVNPDLASEWNYEKNGDLKPTELSTGSGQKVWWKCSNGHEWQAVIASRNQGYGCPVCNESHLEKIIRFILKTYKYTFQEQVKFAGLKGTGNKKLSYDFGVYENGQLDFLIECQGRQHYEPVDFYGGVKQYKIQLEHDRLKQDFCQRNHILLIEIPYTYSDEEIEAIFLR